MIVQPCSSLGLSNNTTTIEEAWDTAIGRRLTLPTEYCLLVQQDKIGEELTSVEQVMS